jgi:hypothetical protein
MRNILLTNNNNTMKTDNNDKFQPFIIRFCGDHFGYYGMAWDDFLLSRGWIAGSVCNHTCSYETTDCEVVLKTINAGIPATNAARQQLKLSPTTPKNMNNNDITPGQDKFLPVNLDEQLRYQPDPLLRYQIDELSKPIRRSTYAPPARDASGRIAASLSVALLILVTTAVLVHCSSR